MVWIKRKIDGDTQIAQYTCTCDALGRRIRKVVPNICGRNGRRRRRRMNTQASSPGGFVVSRHPTRNSQRSSNDNDKRQYVWGQYVDELIQQRDINGGNPDYYLLSDLLYRAVALTDHLGEIQETYDCDAYGNTQIFDSGETRIYNPKCQFIFTGRRFDPETSNATTQMYFYRARYYSPVLGRFISRDPIDYAGGMNLYEYVGGWAVDAVDPMGLIHHPVNLDILGRTRETELEKLNKEARDTERMRRILQQRAEGKEVSEDDEDFWHTKRLKDLREEVKRCGKKSMPKDKIEELAELEKEDIERRRKFLDRMKANEKWLQEQIDKASQSTTQPAPRI